MGRTYVTPFDRDGITGLKRPAVGETRRKRPRECDACRRRSGGLFQVAYRVELVVERLAADAELVDGLLPWRMAAIKSP
jgi:hypothetical protein